MKNLIYLIVLCSFSIVACGSTKNAQIGNWEKLGAKKVNYGLDKDVIKVGAREGGFKKLKVAVTGGALNLHKMTVVYKNGEREKLNLKHNFNKNSDSRVIDLNGGKRFIKEIVFWYDTKNKSRNKATVHVFGKH